MFLGSDPSGRLREYRPIPYNFEISAYYHRFVHVLHVKKWVKKNFRLCLRNNFKYDLNPAGSVCYNLMVFLLIYRQYLCLSSSLLVVKDLNSRTLKGYLSYPMSIYNWLYKGSRQFSLSVASND